MAASDRRWSPRATLAIAFGAAAALWALGVIAFAAII